MDKNDFIAKVTACFKFYGFKFTKILSCRCTLTDFSYGYEIILDKDVRSLPLPFLKDLLHELGTIYLSVFVWEDIVSINVYYK